MAETTSKQPDTFLKLGSPKYPVRFSFAHFFEPVIDEEKIDKKTGKPTAYYSCQVIVDKRDTDTVEAIRGKVAAAAREKLGDKKIPSTWKLPLRDGDEELDEKGEHLAGCWFFNCKSKSKPQVVGTEKWTEEKLAQWDEEHEFETDDWKRKNRPKLNSLIQLGPDDIKSGDYGRISVNFYYFENESKGIAVGLGNIQKLKDGEALGGTRTTADDDFGDLEDGFED